MISIIVPTYNERENIGILIPRIYKALKGKMYEVVIVDDNSPDGTADSAERMGKIYKVKVLRRKGKLGLSSAVLDGIGKSRGDLIVVIDADLSHPPETIPEMVKALYGSDIVVGSRKVKGGGVEGWPLGRVLTSWGASLLARPLTSVKDPMSGFFAFKREIILGKELNPRGFKILLEILVKCDCNNVREIPFIFKDREHGKSKLGKKVMREYLFHLKDLYFYKLRNV